jgi:hypothetical protein
VPTVVVTTVAFEALALTAARALGLADLPRVTVPHPIGGIERGRVVAYAAAAVPRLVEALITTPAPVAAPADERVDARLEAPDGLEEFQEFVWIQGWGDGLPVLPPTPKRVERLLGSACPDDVIAILPPRPGRATRQAIAVNAALAGADAEHMPIIVAAVRAVAEPAFNLQGVLTTTHPCAPLTIVSGPVARRVGINGAENALGSGVRANAVIGRALQLVLLNVGGARPGTVDRATLGHPGKFTYCLAERADASPWAPLHADRGFAVDASCVTVCAAEAPHNVNDHGSSRPEALIAMLAGTAATLGTNHLFAGGEPLVVLGPEHAEVFARAGWSKDAVKRAFWEHARVRVDRVPAENLARFVAVRPETFRAAPPDRGVPLSACAEDVLVIVAGGAGKHSSIVPGFGWSRAVTVRIDE